MKLLNKLNLGCGKDVKKGYLNLDSARLAGVDIVHDLNNTPWPFKANTFDEICCHNVLEHLDNLIISMEEIWRIIKKKGRVIVEVPAFPGPWAATDPTHKHFFTYMTFNYFTSEDRLNYYTLARFKIIKRKLIFHKVLFPFNWFFNISESMQKFHAIFLATILPAYTLYFELEALK